VSNNPNFDMDASAWFLQLNANMQGIREEIAALKVHLQTALEIGNRVEQIDTRLRQVESGLSSLKEHTEREAYEVEKRHAKAIAWLVIVFAALSALIPVVTIAIDHLVWK